MPLEREPWRPRVKFAPPAQLACEASVAQRNEKNVWEIGKVLKDRVKRRAGFGRRPLKVAWFRQSDVRKAFLEPVCAP